MLLGRAVLACAVQSDTEVGEAEITQQALVVAQIVSEIDSLTLEGITLFLLNRFVGLSKLHEFFAARLDVLVAIAVALVARFHADGFQHRRIVDAESRQLDGELRAKQRVHQPSRRLNLDCSFVFSAQAFYESGERGQFSRLTLDCHRARAVQA